MKVSVQDKSCCKYLCIKIRKKFDFNQGSVELTINFLDGNWNLVSLLEQRGYHFI